MKRVVISIIAALAIFAIGNAAGAHAGEVFAEDVVITDAIIPANEYEKAIFRGNLSINSTVIGQQSFKDAIIVGDLTVNGRIIAQEAFKNAVIVGEMTINDDASVDETAFVNENAGNIIKGDVTIENDCKWRSSSPYSRKIILGNVDVKRSLVRNALFYGTIIIGNLNIEKSASFPGQFGYITIVGDVNINNSVLGERSFISSTICGELNCRKTIVYRAFEENGAFYEANIVGAKRFDESSEFISADSKFSDYDAFEHNYIVFSNDVVEQQAYRQTFYFGDITLENSIVEDNAFTQAVILGDMVVNNSVVHTSAFSNAIVAGEMIADDASIFTEALPDMPSHAGQQFVGDIVITDDVVGSGQYKGATFFGNLIIESRFIDQNAFNNAIVLGNLTVKSEKIGTQAFNKVVVDGKLILEEPVELIGIGAFYGAMLSTKNITLPGSVITVADQAFMNIGLSDIGIVDCHKLEKIGKQAFYGCNLTSLIFPLTDNALTIGAGAFWTSKTSGPRDVYLPHHKSNLRYGYPISNSISQKIEDFMNADDNIYLWLDPDNMEECLPIVYGNWQLYGRNYGSYDDWYYSLTPDSNTYGSGALYIPKGTKLLLHHLLSSKIEEYYDYDNPHASTIFLYPFYFYIPIDNWIEIDMGEYPGAGILYRGDLNGDAQTDATDVAILLEMVLAGGVTDAQKAVADLNDDGDVDAVDLSILIEMVLSGE